MTKRKATKLAAFMGRWQQRLGLGGWKLKLEVYERPELPPDVSADDQVSIGHVAPWTDMGTATVHVAEHAAELGPEEIIQHELIHLVLTEMWQTFKRLKEHLPPAVWQLATDAYGDAQELAVNRLMRALREREEREDGEE